VHGELGPVDPVSGRETDLFAGLEGAPDRAAGASRAAGAPTAG